MSAMACEIIGTGDGKLGSPRKNERTASKTIAKDVVLEIIDNALDIVDDKSVMDKIPVEELQEKFALSSKEKPPTPLTGTGDQRDSIETLESPEPVIRHPRVEKKNRLTDLVKNSKQVLAKIIQSESKADIHDAKKGEEKLVEVIDLECPKPNDKPFKSRKNPLPEEVPLPEDNSTDLLKPPEDLMDEIKLNSPKEDSAVEKKRMTFPRASGARARAAFVAKCRTLKKEATLKRKKWDVGSRIANFFRKKRCQIEEAGNGPIGLVKGAELDKEVVESENN